MTAPVLILGAGINGAALARELALNGVGVIVVDTRDIAAGATAYSSRLIHGGLRYLEYGEFKLVRESLAERTRLLKLAPEFVRPLQLFIPVRNRLGGLVTAAKRFLGMKTGGHGKFVHRGLLTVRFGLWLYDRYARDPSLPQHTTMRVDDPKAVSVDSGKFGWLAAYYDAQIVFPERFTLALLADARNIAAEKDMEFRVFTYHQASLSGGTVGIRSSLNSNTVEEFEPAAIVNATGSWVDLTLQSLGVASKRLMGGTKGSHFVTGSAKLKELLSGRAVYTEASDGRPVFVLPFVNGTLIGTTDEPFEGDPATATATPRELDYLVEAVNEVFPDLKLTSADIDMHYAGVRPLPHSDAATTAAVSRGHWLEPNPNAPLPFFSIVGGKLTTCRSLAEESAATILKAIGMPVVGNSEDRPIVEIDGLADLRSQDNSRAEIEAPSEPMLHRTQVPLSAARNVIRNEWVTTLDDLVERRLMLLYHPNLTETCLTQLADFLVEAKLLDASRKSATVEAVIDRLQTRFGKRVQR
jgi:glycerol-3-phosphate dehydrogenase